MPPKWEEVINSQLDELLDQRLCQGESNLLWASNVVLVSKKDGRQGFTIDYRRLEITKKDAYSIPQTQTILDTTRVQILLSD